MKRNATFLIALVALAVVCMALSIGLCACSSSGTEDATVPNTSIDSVTLPEKGSVVFDLQSTDDETLTTSRIVRIKGISMGESKSYAKKLYDAGFRQLYEDTASDDFYGFSALLEGGVCVSGAWSENVLELSVMDADSAQYLLDQDAAARQVDEGADAGTTGEDGGGADDGDDGSDGDDGEEDGQA